MMWGLVFSLSCAILANAERMSSLLITVKLMLLKKVKIALGSKVFEGIICHFIFIIIADFSACFF